MISKASKWTSRPATTAEGDGEETRFTSLLGVNSGDGDGNVMLGVEWYHRGEVQLRDRDFYRNGWFDPGSNAGGFIQAPGYSPNTTNQPVRDGRPADAGRRRPDFSANPTQYAGYFPCNGWPSTRGGTLRRLATAGPRASGNGPRIERPRSIFNRDGSPFVLAGARGYNCGLRHGVQ